MYISGHSKKTALSVFLQNSDLLNNLGTEPFCPATLESGEKFLCLLYKTNFARTTNEARVFLLKNGIKPDSLPPTSDAAEFHIRRAHLQSFIWLNADIPKPAIPSLINFGWKIENNKIFPILKS